MDVYEITGYKTGVSDAGVNYLQPADSFQNILNGFIYRDVLQSRQGFGYFAPRLEDESRIFAIFEHTLPDSTKELLAADQNFLYKYNIATGVFDQIPFGGSLAAYTGFNISAKDRYISGTSYRTAQFLSGGGANPAFTAGNQGARFVFCGAGISPNLPGGSAIFFYNGTDVRDFTNIADNPNYADPPQGDLLSSTFVIWFNERLNFIIPVIAGIDYNQGVLYSGIRTANGNGDKFNVPGSGLFQADTSQNITGATILGQILSINYDRMAYTMEKTRDAFNPYFGRAIPGVVGTNAKFSPVSWDDITKSLGKVGIIGVDGRRNLKVDNKIPNFTRTQIDQKNFNLTYGGFDRTNNQFLWSYLSPESSSSTQDRTLVSNYEEDTWSVYDWRFSVFGQTDLGLDLTWDDIDETSGDASWSRWDTTEDIWDEIGLGEAVQKTLAGDDLGFIYELNKDYDDFTSPISAITAGATTVLTVAATGILEGDLVSISNVEGMVELNNYDTETSELTNNLYVVLAATTTSIEINVDSSLFTAYTTGGTISKTINFYAETIPFNPYRSLGLRCYVGMVEFYLDVNGGRLNVDVFSNEEDSPFIQDVLIKPDSSTQARQWISMGVNQEADFLTFALKQQSPGVQMRLTNMRIHCMAGGPTSG
jgi:hypothetical protein